MESQEGITREMKEHLDNYPHDGAAIPKKRKERER